MFSNIYYKILSLALVITLMGSVTFAADITDVQTDYWAYTVIDNMVTQEIMALNNDGSFTPAKTATKAETLIVIYRAAIAAGLLTPSEGAALATQYESQLQTLGIPPMLAPYGGDVYPALAYALDHEIVVLDEVKYFVSDGAFTSVSKVEASVFFGKALNLYKNENINKIISLSYKDAFEISLSALKYVNLLIDYDIVSGSGDDDGYFNPKSILNRAILAVFADGYFEALTTGVSEIIDDTATAADATDDGIVTGDVETDAEETVTVNGTITDIFSDLNYLEVKTDAGKTVTYNIEGSNIYAGDVAIELATLITDIDVTLTLENGTVVRVDVPMFFDEIEGTFDSLSGYLGEDKDFRSLKTALSSGGYDFKRVYQDTPVLLDGESADVDAIESGYFVKVYYENYTALSIVAYSDNYVFKGMLSQAINIKAPEVLAVMLEDGSTMEMPISSTVSYSNVNSGILNENDIVSVTMKYGKVTNITYVGEIRDVRGMIKAIYISADSEITLDTGDDDEIISVDPLLNIISETGEEGLSIYDLRLNQIANVHIGFNGIEEIRLGDALDSSTFEGTVISIIVSANIMIVVDEDGNSKTVAFSTDSNIEADHYSVGDILEISGQTITESLFEANDISIVIK